MVISIIDLFDQYFSYPYINLYSSMNTVYPEILQFSV